ncbi:hypothetical protein [Streptosporangium minutum]|uniref:Uncharacterized protein n=1 Tax=Streptosporangium minutum TaxID=569862 RepID=A0A243RGC3_9ACTN|nr:hypothetical protein [Streptosporangium minutum]OUC93114.1 hypothetical protein CA984_27490 [Streptosporangium minutum]
MTRMVKTVSATGSARARQQAQMWERLRNAIRGALAVLVLLITAAEAWLTALLGLPPITPVLRRLTEVIADEWRTGAADAIDAEVIDDPDQEVWP